jgi:guanine deaminase
MRRGDGGPFGAVVVLGGEIVARGRNRVLVTPDPTAHAEIVAIRRAARRLGRFDLSGCEIYATTEPCPMCLAAILWARIGRVYFGCTRKDAERAGFDDRVFHDVLAGRARPPLEAETLLNADCLTLFSEWAAKEDKVRY